MRLYESSEGLSIPFCSRVAILDPGMRPGDSGVEIVGANFVFSIAGGTRNPERHRRRDWLHPCHRYRPRRDDESYMDPDLEAPRDKGRQSRSNDGGVVERRRQHRAPAWADGQAGKVSRSCRVTFGEGGLLRDLDYDKIGL